MLSNNQQAFLQLVRAGLWEKEVRLSQYGDVDFDEMYRLAQEQSVIGLVAAGVERVVDIKVPKEIVFQFVGTTMQLEQRNLSMNRFVTKLFGKFKEKGVYALLVKGQGIAQCFERPLWRAAGDVDLLLDAKNYEKSKDLLSPLADEVDSEDISKKHQALKMEGFDVELHGRMPFLISKRVDDGIDEVLNNIFCRGNVRSWNCDGTQVFLPSPDNDVILVFTHFLHHFFIEGVGLRQICDWCRLLYTYRESLDYGLLESWLRKAGIMTEWKAFASLAVDTLGMPAEAMPLYDSRFKNKGSRVLRRVLKSGNFGHNNDLSYRTKYKGMVYKLVSLWRRMGDFVKFLPIFPLDAPRFFVGYLIKKVR